MSSSAIIRRGHRLTDVENCFGHTWTTKYPFGSCPNWCKGYKYSFNLCDCRHRYEYDDRNLELAYNFTLDRKEPFGMIYKPK